MQPVAVLYQASAAPSIGGARKPRKLGGYADSGADIAFVLRARGLPIITPVDSPATSRDPDWVFADDAAGIDAAIRAGARILWANTVLFDGHPLCARIGKIAVVGQHPQDVQRYDDKYTTNAMLRAAGLPVVRSLLVKVAPGDRAVVVTNAMDVRSNAPGPGVSLPCVASISTRV